ncbi:MAG: ferrous iron transport protein A [Butyrivibrio sp.]|nr:ferrous iron transport protein A [Butyrivibrio sp.]
MMPLSMLNDGETATVKKVGGREDTRRFLENLGFVDGAEVTAISSNNGNMIIKIKDSRVALNTDMAKKIMV